ncbi:MULTISPECIES: ribosome maturation factor RimM [unclassified Bacillus (in: firmicutes)]|uniref:ribosome maturation factor RimM n=1 Tax=unclassified Bacillus (in: firmicutes) TaxID=185979 RepID=UPI0008E75EE2|nr:MULTISPECIES: ribosome maturation factor RimM [unclassified Bacillus (in: firmicutes)]SFA74366.1 16S rRNA processing protein RimM [Bacillus sp. UNCCL13]SFQ64602.1 16S rRNA processing protein RimM [Bacillus sp. cl95]
MEKWFNVGKLVNTHGLRGEVRVVSSTDFANERYKKGNTLYLFMPKSNEPIELKVKAHRSHKSFDLLTFEGKENINEVEKFKGGIIKVPESQLGSLPEGEYYYHEIIGCTVITTQEEEIGKITSVLSPGANDVWVIKGKSGKEVLIPFIDEIVMKVDVKEKIVIIEPMEGLLS